MHDALRHCGEQLVNVADEAAARESQRLLIRPKALEADNFAGLLDLVNGLPERTAGPFFVAFAPQKADQALARILRIVGEREVRRNRLGFSGGEGSWRPPISPAKSPRRRTARSRAVGASPVSLVANVQRCLQVRASPDKSTLARI
jgi:hypothetical protein